MCVPLFILLFESTHSAHNPLEKKPQTVNYSSAADEAARGNECVNTVFNYAVKFMLTVSFQILRFWFSYYWHAG